MSGRAFLSLIAWSIASWWASLAMNGVSTAAVSGFVETFSGTGEYASAGGRFQGLDNPGWQMNGDGEITEQGYVFVNESADPDNADVERLTMQVLGVGSFREEVIVRNFDLGEVPFMGSPDAGGAFTLIHLGSTSDDVLGIYLVENSDTENGLWTLITQSSDLFDRRSVPRGPDVSFQIVYDHSSRNVTMSYDPNILDADPPMSWGPYPYSGSLVADDHFTQVGASGSGSGKANGILERWTLMPFSDIPGDFDGDEVLHAIDIDLLNEQIRAGTNDPLFDLNADARVDTSDRDVWVHDLKGAYYGDANLDGEFASTDLVNVLAAGQYEDGTRGNSTWLTGDWDGDGDFASSDLVLAFADGGYEQGPRDVRAVPEPSMIYLLTVAVSGLFLRRRSRCIGPIDIAKDLCAGGTMGVARN